MPDAPLSPDFLALQRAVAGRYSLVREIGRGGMGIVFLARDVALDRQVAIKLLPPELAAQPTLRERFLREARMAASLAHPNIVPIHAVEASDHLVWFVMAYVDGESLGERVRRRGPLPVADAVRIGQEVAWALAHAHARGIVHHDIKPDNILLERESGRAIVTDFGIARAVTGDTPAGGTPAGTPRYLSPEVARGDPGDGRADLYALGVTLWFALTGRHPIDAPTLPALLARQASEPAPSLATADPALPARLVRAVDRALARDPADRWPTVETFAAALDDVRARARDIPAPVRAWVRDSLAAGNDITMGFLGVGTTLGALTLSNLGGSSGGLGGAFDSLFFAIAMFSMGSLFAGLALVRFGSTVMSTRDLVRDGHDHTEAAAGIAREESDRMAEQASVPVTERRRRAAVYGATGTLKAALAAWISTFSRPEWLAFPAAALAVLLAVITIRTVWSGLRPGPSLWSRLLRGRFGRFLFREAGRTVRKRRLEVSPGHPTLLALGGETEALFQALPAPVRQQLHELPGMLAALRDEADLLRGRDDEAAAGRLATVAAAMESVRLELLSLEAGLSSIPDVTRHLEASWRVAEAVDAALVGRPGETPPGLEREPTPA